MKTLTNSLAKVVVLTAVLCSALAINYLQAAWTGPTASAPNNNVDAPINIGTTDQVKDAGIALTGNFLVQGTGMFGSAQAVSEGLTVDVEGRVGATQYCDNNGLNCRSVTEMGGGLPTCAAGQYLQYLSEGDGWGCVDNASNALNNCTLEYRYALNGAASWQSIALDGISRTGDWSTKIISNLSDECASTNDCGIKMRIVCPVT